jgi:hypothetical protein
MFPHREILKDIFLRSVWQCRGWEVDISPRYLAGKSARTMTHPAGEGVEY